jgi:hypothetical protein
MKLNVVPISLTQIHDSFQSLMFCSFLFNFLFLGNLNIVPISLIEIHDFVPL